MLMAMRPQKTQLTSLYKYTAAGASSFTKRDHAIMHGYTDFDVMVVGAAGGRAGNSSGNVSGYGTMAMYGGGPGGGGSQRVKGKLIDLPSTVALAVGAAGSNGGNVGLNTFAPNGGNGGSSNFGTVASATGGGGGKGGKSNDPIYQSVGGVGGNGGVGPGATAGQGTSQNLNSTSVPGTSGNWVDDGNGGGSGGGGGGGYGVYGQNGDTTNPASAGGSGAQTGPVAAGEPIQQTYYAGGGGGADISPVTGGATELYGTGYNTGHGGGVVVIKLS